MCVCVKGHVSDIYTIHINVLLGVEYKGIMSGTVRTSEE